MKEAPIYLKPDLRTKWAGTQKGLWTVLHSSIVTSTPPLSSHLQPPAPGIESGQLPGVLAKEEFKKKKKSMDR